MPTNVADHGVRIRAKASARTLGGTYEKSPHTAFPLVRRLFLLVWQVQDLNLRRLTRRFYRTLSGELRGSWLSIFRRKSSPMEGKQSAR
jgi:hypothetical protein